MHDEKLEGFGGQDGSVIMSPGVAGAAVSVAVGLGVSGADNPGAYRRTRGAFRASCFLSLFTKIE